MKALAEDEIASLTERLTELCQVRLPALLLPPSQTAQLSAILELKAGAGGDEASLFVEEVLRMYMRYAADRGWRTSILSKTVGNVGGNGLKDVTLEVKGEGAFGDFRFERGVHRVQRVPATESAGRVHTSTIAVVVSHSSFPRWSHELTMDRHSQVLPLSENNNESSTDDVVDEKDVKTEVMRSRGAGGQVILRSPPASRNALLNLLLSYSMSTKPNPL
jgi:peptide chain release factor 1